MRLLALLGICAAAWAADAPRFDYDEGASLFIRDTGAMMRDGVAVRDITYAGAVKNKIEAYLITSPKKGRHAAVLFVHWYDSKAPNSNRTQYLDEAVALAKKGVTSLLIETMWSKPDWFEKRKRAEDYDRTVDQVKELRRAFDVLVAQQDVDKDRVGFVGHDFGGMVGALLAGVDRRPKAWCIIASTPAFSDWYLLGTKLDPAAKQKVVDELAPLDPARHIAKAAPSPVLFQFATNDPFVPKTKAEEFFAAAKDPKEIKWYDAGHEMNAKAMADRDAWLTQKLNVR